MNGPLFFLLAKVTALVPCGGLSIGWMDGWMESLVLFFFFFFLFVYAGLAWAFFFFTFYFFFLRRPVLPVISFYCCFSSILFFFSVLPFAFFGHACYIPGSDHTPLRLGVAVQLPSSLLFLLLNDLLLLLLASCKIVWIRLSDSRQKRVELSAHRRHLSVLHRHLDNNTID